MRRATQQGFTLLELMIALTVGLLLIAGSVTMMGNSSDALKRHEINADMTSALRLADNTLRRDIQAAGYFGRTRFPADIEGRSGSPDALPALTGDCHAGFYVDLSRYVYASEGTNPFATTCLPASLVDYKEGTDVLVVRYAQDGEMDGDSVVGDLDADTMYILGNPTGGEVFRGNNPPSVVKTPYVGNFDKNIKKRFYELVTHVYFVGDVVDDEIDGDALYRLRLDLSSSSLYQVELVSSDIIDMQVLFGVEDCSIGVVGGSDACSGDIDNYVNGGGFELDGTLPTYAQVAKIRGLSVSFVALSDRIMGADEMPTTDHKMRDQDVQASRAAQFRSTTYQVRNSETIFPGS